MSDGDIEQIVATYKDSDVSMLELARSFKVSDYSIRQILLSAGVELRGRAVPADQVETVRSMRSRGDSVTTIAAFSGISESYVRLLLVGPS